MSDAAGQRRGAKRAARQQSDAARGVGRRARAGRARDHLCRRLDLLCALCAIAAGGILWEWTSLVVAARRSAHPGAGLAALAVGRGACRLELADCGMGAIAIGAIVAGCIVAAWPRRPTSRSAPAWAAGGVIYAGACLLGPALLRSDPQWGLTALLFLFATVWTTDIFAYFCGRAIGGPLLWPRVSPKKTWSGAIGGLAGGVAAGVAVAYASGVGKLGIVGVMALCSFGPGAGRRPVRVRGQAAFRRQGCEPAHPRSRRIDGSSRRLPGRGFCRAPHRHGSSRNCCARARLAGMVEPMKKKQPRRRRGVGAGRKAGTACRDAAGRHRLDRLEHRRSVAPGVRALSRRGGDRASQCRRAGAARARARRALCRRRRSGCLRRTQGRAVRLRHRSGRRRRGSRRGGATSRRLGDGGDHRRDEPQADARRGRARRHRGARQQGMSGLRRRAVHAPRRRRRRHGACRSIPSTTRSSRRSAPAAARMCAASS